MPKNIEDAVGDEGEITLFLYKIMVGTSLFLYKIVVGTSHVVLKSLVLEVN